MKNSKSSKKKIVIFFLAIIGAAISLFPFYWIFIGATKSSGEILSFPPSILPGDELINNFKNLNDSINILKVLFNSVFISVIFTILSLFITTFAGYAFAKFKFKGRDLIFFILLTAVMI